MLRVTLVLLSFILVCTARTANPKIIDINSELYKKSLDDAITKAGINRAALTSDQFQKLEEEYIKTLTKEGYTITSSRQPLQPVTSGPPQPISGPPQPISGPPQPISGPPQPISGPPQLSLMRSILSSLLSILSTLWSYLPPAGFFLPPVGSFFSLIMSFLPSLGSIFPSFQTPLSPRFSQSLSGTRQTLNNALDNQAENFLSGVDSVIKGTDEVLGEVGYQFQKLNHANKELIKQAASTKGTTISMVPKAGTNMLKTIENVVEDPTSMLRQPSALEKENKRLMEKLRANNRQLHIQLTIYNEEIMEILKNNPEVFEVLLQEQNWPKLQKILQQKITDPSKLKELLLQ